MAEISVIIPVYNTGALLIETVNSVLEQSFTDFELILVDDGSREPTREIIAGFTDERIVVITQPNGGVASARNTGISAARGRYIALLDHDDLWHKDKLLIQKQMLDSDSEAVLVYSPIEVFGSSDTIDIPDYGIVGSDAFVSELEQNKIHSTSCVMFRKETVEKNGIAFDRGTVPCDDWYFYLQLAQYGKFIHSQDVPVYYRLHQGNQSSDTAKMYNAGITVLGLIKEQLPDISRRLEKCEAELLQILLSHLAKHYRGLTRLALKRRAYKEAYCAAKQELKANFSLKALILFLLAAVLRLILPQ